MVAAQAFTEYASASSIADAIGQARYTVASWASSLTTTQWALVGVGVVAIAWFWRRRLG